MHREEAEALATALDVGIVDVSEVVDWAVDRIAEEEHPHWSLCEIAIAGRKYPQDVAALLREIPGTFSASDVRRRVLSMMAPRLERDPRRADGIASALYQLALADEIEDGELKALAWWAWDRLDLADSGTIAETREQIVQRMIRELSRCIARTVDAGKQGPS